MFANAPATPAGKFTKPTESAFLLGETQTTGETALGPMVTASTTIQPQAQLPTQLPVLTVMSCGSNRSTAEQSH